MKYLFIAEYFQIIALFSLSKFNITHGIIGGFWKSVKHHPYLVVVAYEIPIPCGGTIIMPSWVLTAARCIHHGHVGIHGVIGVRIGVTNFDTDKGQLVRKKSLHVHPYFLSDASYALSVNDIGLIQLIKPLEFGPHVHPVGVSMQHIKDNSSCVTMGWGVINPTVYLTGQLKDQTFWPKKGENSLRDIEQQTSGTLNECTRVMRRLHKKCLHPDWHICAIFYPYGINPSQDPTAARGPMKPDKRWMHRVLSRTNRTKKGRGKRPRFIDEYHDYIDYYKTPSYWEIGYSKIRINTHGPSYYDYGGPLMCYGQQVGIFTFPVANVQQRENSTYRWIWPPTARAVYTLLAKYVPWIDAVIELEASKAEQELPPVKEEGDTSYNIWDILSDAKFIRSNKIIIISLLISVSLLY